MTPQQAKKFLKDNDVKFVLAQFVDIHGAAKAKAVPVEHLDMVLTDGAGFAGFALWGFGMGPHGPDYMAVGDLDTLQHRPWMPGFARMAPARHVHGKPYPYCSRVALKNAARRAGEEGPDAVHGHRAGIHAAKRRADGSLGPCDATRHTRQALLRLQGPRAQRARSSSGWSTRCGASASTSTRSTTRTRTASSK